MNIINTCATYTGYEKAIKALRFEIPNRGKGPATPIFVLPSFAAQNTSVTPGAFEEGSKVLIAGRLYKRVQTEEETEELLGKLAYRESLVLYAFGTMVATMLIIVVLTIIPNL